MTDHLFIPGALVPPRACQPVYVEYLTRWREAIISSADEGDIAASQCLQATLIDLALSGKALHDWLGVMDEHLLAGGVPLAYSEKFGARLYRFQSQYRQSTIHAIHTRWWIESLMTPDKVDHGRFADLVLAKKNTDGLIYDRDVSGTILRHRMKSELTISAAMAADILSYAELITEKLGLELATHLADPRKCPPLGYMGMEYFRLYALRLFGHQELFPAGIDARIAACTTGLPVGWCDFSMTSKVDAYMGTAKRTQRDKPVHSPMTALQVLALAEMIVPTGNQAPVKDRFAEYARHLKETPNDIPAFQMRDVPIPFGADRTPIEIICASNVIASCPKD